MSDHIPEVTKMVCPHCEAGVLIMEVATLRTANKALVEQAAATQVELDKSARILLETVNDRNRIGVQLDLLRDELLRIRARIAETGLIGEHPELGSIAGYCERAQKDIAVMYTPIQEREQISRELTACRNERADLVDENALLKERVKRLEAWGDRLEELLGDPPRANCSCHISPPCSDCVEWAAIREAKAEWNQAKETKP